MKKIKLFISAIIICLAVVFSACGNDIKVEGITLNRATALLIVNSTVQLTATLTPLDATDKSITWSSDKEEIATVSKTGLVKGIAEGVAVITAMTNDGQKTAECIVTVTLYKTLQQIKAGLESAGYNTMNFGGVLRAARYDGPNLESITLEFFESEEQATQSKPECEAIAAGLGFMCKQDRRIIYYGTAVAMQDYEAI